MTCYNDHLFTEFLIQTLITELRIDPTRVHVSGLSNGAQESTKMFWLSLAETKIIFKLYVFY